MCPDAIRDRAALWGSDTEMWLLVSATAETIGDVFTDTLEFSGDAATAGVARDEAVLSSLWRAAEASHDPSNDHRWPGR